MEIKLNSPKYGEKIVLIDDEDYFKINGYSWYLYYDNKNCINYVVAWVKKDNKRINIKMHRLITDCPREMEVDHINHNTLDNRKCNLRVCTHAENSRNRIINKNNNSGYIGVNLKMNKVKGHTYMYWDSRITFNYKRIQLGLFKNKKDAAIAYNEAAIKYFGEFANLNIIE